MWDANALSAWGNVMTLARREFLRLIAAAPAVGASFLRRCSPQTYPARPIKVIVPVAAGGPVDVITRTIVQQLLSGGRAIPR